MMSTHRPARSPPAAHKRGVDVHHAFGEGGYRTSFWPTDREMRRSVFDFHFPKFQNLETARGLVYNFFPESVARWRGWGEKLRIIQVSVLGASPIRQRHGLSIFVPLGPGIYGLFSESLWPRRFADCAVADAVAFEPACRCAHQSHSTFWTR